MLIYKLSGQINELHLSMEALYQTIDILKKNQDMYQLDLHQKDLQIKDLISQINNPIQIAIENHETLRAHNDMTQFYIKTAGVVIASVAIIFLAQNLTGFFTLKLLSPQIWLPKSVYTFIQNNTPFFHEIKSYSYIDNVNDIIYRVTITDDTLTSILAKYSVSPDYIDISSFITSAMGNSGTVVSALNNIPSVNTVFDTVASTPVNPVLDAVTASVIANHGSFITTAQMMDQALSFIN
jgi:hypothetical protein